MRRIRAAVVGFGRWGPNLARNFHLNPSYDLVALCDTDASRLERARSSYPSARRYNSARELLASADAELVAVATPVHSHVPVAKAALESGRHVLCEKPLAVTLHDAADLVDTAGRRGRHLFVDHTLTYASAVRAIREAYVESELGELLYVDSVRINPARAGRDVDVMWDLAPHDISALRFVLGRNVVAVQATSQARHGRFLDMAYLTVDFEGGLTAHLHLSLLSPVKVRRMILPGRRALLTYDELERGKKISLFRHDDEQPHHLMSSDEEPLAIEMREIAQVLRPSRSPNVDRPRVATGADGFEVVRVLDAARRSLLSGERVHLCP